VLDNMSFILQVSAVASPAGAGVWGERMEAGSEAGSTHTEPEEGVHQGRRTMERKVVQGTRLKDEILETSNTVCGVF